MGAAPGETPSTPCLPQSSCLAGKGRAGMRPGAGHVCDLTQPAWTSEPPVVLVAASFYYEEKTAKGTKGRRDVCKEHLGTRHLLEELGIARGACLCVCACMGPSRRVLCRRGKPGHTDLVISVVSSTRVYRKGHYTIHSFFF